MTTGRLDALRSMVAIAEVPGEPGILDELVSTARRLLSAPFGIALLVSADGTPTALSHQGMTEEQVGAMPHLPRPVGLVGVVLAGTVLRLTRMADHPASVGFPVGHVAMGALLAAPITVDDTVLGALYLTRSPDERAFSAEEEAEVLALARMAGLVVAVRRRMIGRRDALDGLVTMGLGLTETAERGPLGTAASIDQLVDAARAALGVDVAFLSHLDDARQTVSHVSARPGTTGLSPGMLVPTAASYCAAVLRGDLPSSIPDVAAHPVASAIPVSPTLRAGSYNGVPVTLEDGSVHGTLCALDGAGTTVADSASRTETLQVLARLVAGRIDHHRAERRRSDGDRAVLAPLLDGSRRTTVLQPIVALATGHPVGYEALSRFTDVHGGALRPDLVFAEATRLQLGPQLEQAALASALQLLPRIPDTCYLSVNVSPRALADPATHDLLTSVPGDRLLLEITEHEAVPDYRSLARLTGHLRHRGIRIAVDDAGSGYASLQHVTELSPDVIKLDIAFVRHVDTDRNRRAIARALIAYAGETGATLVAEGIETPAERDQLLALGAPLGQGYLLGRPQPVDDLFPRPAPPRALRRTPAAV
ncbi:EAL domain, c-di-GMP-specific phosphodiesterase class I (or its enzymatically inactive variant) [Klenkia soli]|uniref:EAL domain, c-di-GMP-specific phosphodiesterase class I (Or its enzymatically inactive variant) n=1 Tax=Klenkia soli TaxID=1052260 RepID=A0A1H0U699_9ACTN|nr:EAL domain-containing protein [Klenkia soli]SDP61797.1 EAL domain, c-di-GMP-specific phosphodiesterase class I (or its enzymatically inactive variant) [Klenkia soli]